MIETSDLLLRKITSRDLPLFERLHQDERVMRWVSDIDEQAQREKFWERVESSNNWHKTNNDWLTLVIIDKCSGEAVGLHGFLSMWQPYLQAELGFMLLPEFHGKGFAKKSTKAVINFAFLECGYHKLIATVSEGNEASFGLLKAMGFELEGTLKHNYKIAGRWINDQKLALFSNN